jgi:hypothetical protein
MKNFILILMIGAFTFISCKKDPQTEYNGKIIGYDLTMCACCGGIIIDIDKAQYRFDSLPLNSDIDLSKDTFPIYVVVSWHKKAAQCLGDEIIIDKIRKK